MHHLIIGGGIAGTTAAEALRQLDSASKITLVSEEQHPLYSRVLLPHYIDGRVPRQRVFLKKEAWYAEQGITWLPGERAIHLDPRNKFVAVASGRQLPYDRLLIATGGDARPLGYERRGISYLRTVDDADHLLQLLHERSAAARAGIYGSGFIACEYLNIFTHFGLPTTIALRRQYFWPRVFGPESGNLLNQHLRERGVTVLPETADTDPALSTAEILGIGIGLEPDFSWLRPSGIALGTGVLVNEFLETNIPDVYAAGDVAEFFDSAVLRQRVVGNWLNAITQARVVARTMVGQRTALRLVSSYATHGLGLSLVFVGDTAREAADEVRVQGSAAEGGVTQLFIRQGRLVGATLVNRHADRDWVTKGIAAALDMANFS